MDLPAIADKIEIHELLARHVRGVESRGSRRAAPEDRP